MTMVGGGFGGESVATVDTAGEGYFLPYWIHGTSTSSGVIVVADDVRAAQFILPFRATANRILTEVVTVGGAGKLYGVGIYDINKNLLTETGALDANTVQFNETTITQITFEPGVYWFAWTSDSGTVQLRNGTAGNSASALNAMSTKRSAIAGNSPISPGVLPAALGTTTTASTSSPPIAPMYIE